MHMRILAVVVAALFVVCAADVAGAPAQLTVRVPKELLRTAITVEIRPTLDKKQPVRRLFFDGETVETENIPLLRRQPDANTMAISLALPPEVYHLTAIDNVTGQPLGKMTLAAESDGRYLFQVTRPTFLSPILTAAANPANLPVAVITLLAAALAGALRDKLKALWEWTLDAVGRLGIRRLRERSFTRAYLRNLVYNHTYLKLIGLNTTGFSRPQLERVFISLRIASYDQRAGTAVARDSVPFDSAAGRFPRLVILGAPGAGKTTTLSYALLQFAHGRGLSKFGIAEPLLPIFIPLRRLSGQNRSLIDDLVDPSTQILPEEVLARCPAGYFQRKLKAGRCVLLLDGLDEVASESQHRLVAQKINNLVAAWPRNRVIVTCRTAGWQGLLPEFQVLQTQDLDRTEIHSFIEGWHTAVITEMERNRLRLHEPDEARFEEAWRRRRDEVATAIDVQSRKLIHAIEGNQRIQAVATNPMLLSLICLVHLSRHILPRGRALLYRECIEMLTDAWDRERDLMSTSELTYTQKEAALRQIALAFQQSGKGELPRARLESVAGEVARDLGASITGAEFVEVLERRSGLLIERSIDVIGFSHLTLQEYLIARHIQQNPKLFHLLKENVGNAAWREIILLYCGLVDDATPVVEFVFAPQSIARTMLAAHCTGESQKCDPQIVTRIIDKLLVLVESPVQDPFVESPVQDLDIEALTSALAAVAADYKDAPVTHEQHLSQWLIRNPSNIAMDALGRARVTKALPLLVQTLGSDSPQTVDTAKSALTMFGDLALPEMQKALTAADLRRFAGIERFVSTLGAINTGSAARLLLYLYGFGAPGLREYVSMTLASMFRGDRIVDELLDLPSLSVHPSDIPYSEPAERAGWKYWRPGTRAFRSLEAIIRHHLVFPRLPKVIAFLRRPSIRIMLPTLLESLPHLVDPPRFFAAAGFTGSPRLRPLIDEVAAAAKRGDLDLWTTLERARTAREATAEGRKSRPALRLIALGGMTAWHTLTVLYLIQMLVFETQPAARFHGFSVLAAWNFFLTATALWWRRRSIVSIAFIGAALCPYPTFLRRLPRIAAGKPWLAFAVFSWLAMTFSFPGLWASMLMIAPDVATTGALFRDSLGALVFIGFMALYYATVVLPSDPLRELIELHPEGRELLRRG